MTGNAKFTCADVAVVAVTSVEAPVVVSSDDFDARLAPYYKKTGMQPGMLQALAGITERRQWPADTPILAGAAEAGRLALEQSGVDPARIGLLIDTSVCRERLEPSSAVTVHDSLGLSSSCMNFDLSNACLGFLNGIYVASLMIDNGQIEYALIVDSEGSNQLQDSTIETLLADDATVEDLFTNFASLTLGSGATAMVVGRHSTNPGSHKVVGGLFRAETTHHDLCVGSLDQMRTDAAGLLAAGSDLARVAWDDARMEDWQDMDCYIIHQVSRVHTAEIVKVLGIDAGRVPQIFSNYGNVGPAAIPITLTKAADDFEEGDRILCLGIGSGLNTAVVEIVW